MAFKPDVVALAIKALNGGGGGGGDVPIATTTRPGKVMPDGTTITVEANGRIHAPRREMTQAEYDLLTPAEKNNGTVYYITDGGGGAGGVVDGYRNPADGLFYADYADDTFSTLIIGQSATLYTDKLTDSLYRWNGTEYVQTSGSGGGDASLESNVTSNMAVGAIASGTTLAQGTTFTEFVQKLLITEIAPTIGFSITKSGNVAYGGSYTETLTVNASNLGTAKKINTIKWYEGSTLLQTDTIDSTTTGSWTYTMPTPTTDTTTFKAVVTYTKSSDTTADVTKTASINFYYNKFYGVVNSLTPTEAAVEALTAALATGKGGTYSFTASAARIAYAYPSSLGALTQIKDGSGFSLFDSFTRTTETYTQNGTAVSYYLYVLTDPATVTNYSVTFA